MSDKRLEGKRVLLTQFSVRRDEDENARLSSRDGRCVDSVGITFADGRESRLRDNDRIKKSDSEEFTSAAQPLGELEILSAGLRVPARMVVRDNEGNGPYMHGSLKDFPRMYQRRGRGADAVHLVGDRAVASIEQEQDEMLTRVGPHQFSNETCDIFGISNRLWNPSSTAAVSNHGFADHHEAFGHRVLSPVI